MKRLSDCYPLLIVGANERCMLTKGLAEIFPQAEKVYLDEFSDGAAVEGWLVRETNDASLPMLFCDGYVINGLSEIVCGESYK